jgi:hypothetical protein
MGPFEQGLGHSKIPYYAFARSLLTVLQDYVSASFWSSSATIRIAIEMERFMPPKREDDSVVYSEGRLPLSPVHVAGRDESHLGGIGCPTDS